MSIPTLRVALFASLAACTSEVGGTGYVPGDPGSPPGGASANSSRIERDWTGQRIDVRSDGVAGSLAGEGITITVDPAATRITATAKLRPESDGSSIEAAGSFAVSEESGALVFRCARAAAAREGGCEKVTLVVPPGTTATPLSLDVTLRDYSLVVISARTAVVSRVLVKSGGDIDATLPANKGAEIDLEAASARDVMLKLPAGFSADYVALNASEIDRTEFSDVVSGQPRGPVGTGAKLIRVTSVEYAGSTGKITLRKD